MRQIFAAGQVYVNTHRSVNRESNPIKYIVVILCISIPCLDRVVVGELIPRR